MTHGGSLAVLALFLLLLLFSSLVTILKTVGFIFVLSSSQ